MPAPSPEQTVRQGADMIRRLVEMGADPLGLADSTIQGEPVIVIREPGHALTRLFQARRLLAVERSAGVEELWVGILDDCYILWTALAVRGRPDTPVH